MEFTKTLDDIISYTGLKEQFIRKCIKSMPDIFNTNITRGDKNAIILNDNAFVLFDKIKQLKEQGQSITSIHQNINNMLSENTIKTNKSENISSSNTEEHKYIDILINELKSSNGNTIKAFEETIKTQKEHIQSLENQMLLLTSGKTPEEMKLEQKNKEQEIFNLIQNSEDKNKEIEIIKKTVSDKDNQLAEIENLKKKVDLELEQQKQKDFQKEYQKSEIIKQIQSLEGKFFVRKKRVELLKQLQELS